MTSNFKGRYPESFSIEMSYFLLLTTLFTERPKMQANLVVTVLLYGMFYVNRR